MTQPEKMELTSMDVAAQKRQELKQALGNAFPEVFAEGSIDFDQLKRVLGEWVDPSKERFGLNWAGKAECMRVIQQPSVAALKPMRDHSINFDETDNLFIEGDNLEVLKLLQKAYFGKVKAIFIDPPYNTGNEFIYPDKYSETIETYLNYTSQTDDGGRKFSTNTEISGRYHSRWLSMMYPRLYLAKNLLREDGVIFIAIDDHEIDNLRKLCTEIYGEDNLVAHIIWQHSVQPKGYTDIFSIHHNHILCFRKSEDFSVSPLERTDKDNKAYSNPDNDPRGLWRTGDVRNALYRPNLIYEIVSPSGHVIQPPENGWRWSKSTMQEKISSGEVRFSVDGTKISRRIYLNEQDGRAPETIWFGEDVGTTREASNEIKSLFDGKAPFDTVKPIKLMERAFQIAGLKKGDICLDFFAGSGSTAHAVLNMERSANFIVVQLPEQISDATPHGKLALEMGFSSISDISRERIKRVVQKMQNQNEGKLSLSAPSDVRLGFRSFRLDRSNFSIWNQSADTFEQSGTQLDLHVDHVTADASPEDILYELLLKAGFPLTTKVQSIQIANKNVFSVHDGAMLICLESEITAELIDALAEANPLQVICLDEGFKGNDQLKANAVQTFKARAQADESEIVFRTV